MAIVFNPSCESIVSMVKCNLMEQISMQQMLIKHFSLLPDVLRIPSKPSYSPHAPQLGLLKSRARTRVLCFSFPRSEL